MKKLFCLLLCLSFAVLNFTACKKDRSCENCEETNKPPIAVAGPDQVVSLPVDSTSLDGSASNDPDGTIRVWQWRKIEGPAAFTIVNAATAMTVVNNLDTGVYRFELMVTDDGGLSATDTVQVIVGSVMPGNRPPIAHAGNDTAITLPASTALLDGSRSTDPDNNIAVYQWTKLSGPSSFNITNANVGQTQVTSLVAGEYQFELKVTDAGGLFSMDTVVITVKPQSQQAACGETNRPTVNATLAPVGNLSIGRAYMAAAAVGNRILFAGGVDNLIGDQIGSKRVDIYNVSTNTWTTARLSIGRHNIAAVGTGNRAFFAAGDEFGDGDVPVSVVDIYHAPTNTWAVDVLPTIGGGGVVAATAGNKVVFAGHNSLDPDVNIYNLDSRSWTTHKLPETRLSGAATAAAGNKIYISGGWLQTGAPPSNKVHIYDYSTDSWTSDIMMEGKMFHAGVALANKVFWAGGLNTGSFDLATCQVEIRDLQTNMSTTSQLSKPTFWSYYRGVNSAVVSNNKVVFLRTTGDKRNQFDIYDVGTSTWSIGVLPQEIPEGAAVVVQNNTIYIAGGVVNGDVSRQVWKLEF